MIDIEFVIPICLNGKYLNRINNFLKYGIINYNNNSIKITILVDREENNLLNQLKNPNNHNLKIVECPIGHEACKVYFYFSHYDKRDLDSTRWIAKIDDDSVNDVGLLVKKLDEEYNCDEKYYIIAGLQQDIDSIEQNLLWELGYGDWFDYNNMIGNHIIHEKEGSIVSRAGLRAILTNPKAIEFLLKRSYIDCGYTDQALAAAARICKIYPSSPLFLTHEPTLSNFSIFGGKLAHVHFIAEDINESIFKILKSKIDNKIANFPFVEKYYKLSNSFEEVNNTICFHDNYTISSIHNECYWKLWYADDKNLTLYSNEMPEIVIEYNDSKEMRGTFNTALKRLS